ncbi:MAG: zinc ribbon domain-containing protein [Deltaproteobacteria bacterium]|nr:zinc ribbon domain-containing protein [Deltaproteobacteria bacterium]MBW1943601.1 zinc ribbon domain-containing protein [Deltaproteobacteria bacterium]MBW2205330.1 zinc ribbon domain-containing protein [Deltaproteobacteria bacterium]
MNCITCHTHNRGEAKFCRKCGDPLLRPCPRCGNRNPPECNFCDECGHGLTLLMEPSLPGMYALGGEKPFRCRFPSDYMQSILEQRPLIEGVSREVTVACYTLDGLGMLEENAGSGDPAAFRDEICEILLNKVHECKGTVNNITDDTVIALFGLPILLEFAAQRAIFSAMAIHKEVAFFNRRRRKSGGAAPLIKIRAGMHTGQVMAGNLDSDLRVSFHEGKDIVQLAYMMAKLAEPGTTSVTEETLKRSGDGFHFKSIGEKKIKGKEGSLPVYRLTGPDSSKGKKGSEDHDPPAHAHDKKAKPTTRPADPSPEAPYGLCMPWKSTDLQKEDISGKTKLILSLSSFYLVLAVFLIWEFLLPRPSPIQLTQIFSSYWASLVVLLAAFLLGTFCLYHLAVLGTRMLLGQKGRNGFKLGTLLVREGYISEKELDDALDEQKQRIGEKLLHSGSITDKQLDEALCYQEDASCRLGVALRELGYTTDEEISEVLNKRNRKLGEILREKGLVSEYELYWILTRGSPIKRT